MTPLAPPEVEGAPAIQGRVAHWVAENKYRGIEIASGTERDGIKVDDDMLAGAQLWVDNVPLGGTAEMPVVASSIHPTDVWGTPDLWVWDEANAVLSVYEYKYGFVLVDEFENEQIIGQAAGIIDTMGYKPKKIICVVVQPRAWVASKVRSWEMTIEEFPSYLQPIIDAVADGQSTNVGTYCKFCSAASICGTFRTAASKVVEYAGLAEPIEITPDLLGAENTVITAAIELLKARKVVLDAMAEAELRKGVRVPGWEMKSRQGSLAWQIDDQAVIAYGKATGKDLAKAAEPITPTQARDRKLIDEEDLKTLASRAPSTMKLSPISTAVTRRIFS